MFVLKRGDDSQLLVRKAMEREKPDKQCGRTGNRASDKCRSSDVECRHDLKFV